MICINRITKIFLVLSLLSAPALAQNVAINEWDSRQRTDADNVMSPDVIQLMQLLKVKDTVDRLRAKQSIQTSSNEDLIETIMLRQKLVRTIQYASLELEEALANIDGELASTNMQYAYFSSKRDKFLLLNNIATFVGSGTMGVLDSSTSIKYGAPMPNIFGITGNSISVALPLLGLVPMKYKNLRDDHGSSNMLAPLFGKAYSGTGYDPIIWKYLETVPAESKSNLTRRQTLINSWKKYHGLSGTDAHSKTFIDALTGMDEQNKKISPDLLKTRAELLVELRAQIQQMYRDISNFNTATADL